MNRLTRALILGAIIGAISAIAGGGAPNGQSDASNKVDLDELKFHWDKWKDESRVFWSRATLATGLLLLSILFQFSIFSISIEHPIKFQLPSDPRPLFQVLNALSWFLLLF